MNVGSMRERASTTSRRDAGDGRLAAQHVVPVQVDRFPKNLED